MDNDGYPTQEELDTIANWKLNLPLLANYVQERWNWGKNMWIIRNGKTELGQPCLKIKAHTGGWSGNEAIIDALAKNQLFWLTCWVSSRRGGHYEFEIRLLEEPK